MDNEKSVNKFWWTALLMIVYSYFYLGSILINFCFKMGLLALLYRATRWTTRNIERILPHETQDY